MAVRVKGGPLGLSVVACVMMLATACDPVRGDLFTVGSNGPEGGQPDAGFSSAVGEGRAYVFAGSAAGIVATPSWTLDPTDQADARYGTAVAGVGDTNGDGFDDVAVGAERWGSTPAEGRAYLYFGASTGLGTSSAWTADPTDLASGFGHALSGAGDINGDGFSDVVVGAHEWNGSHTAEGRFDLFFGGDKAIGLDRQWRQYRSDGTTRMGLGTALTDTTVVIRGRGTLQVPWGMRPKLEVEVKDVGAAFTGTGTFLSSGIQPGGTASVAVSGLSVGAKRWRARWVYPNGAFATRWVDYGGNSSHEPDFVVMSLLTSGGGGGPGPSVVPDAPPLRLSVGCGCTAGSEGASLLLWALLALVGVRRRVEPRKNLDE